MACPPFHPRIENKWWAQRKSAFAHPTRIHLSPRTSGERYTDQNFTVMPEYTEDSVQEPLVTVAPPTTAVQAKARL
jgi:hypothetical protein